MNSTLKKSSEKLKFTKQKFRVLYWEHLSVY